jgi:hypothetical protein
MNEDAPQQPHQTRYPLINFPTTQAVEALYCGPIGTPSHTRRRLWSVLGLVAVVTLDSLIKDLGTVYVYPLVTLQLLRIEEHFSPMFLQIVVAVLFFVFSLPSFRFVFVLLTSFRFVFIFLLFFMLSFFFWLFYICFPKTNDWISGMWREAVGAVM